MSGLMSRSTLATIHIIRWAEAHRPDTDRVLGSLASTHPRHVHVARCPNQDDTVTDVCENPSEGTVTSRWPVLLAIRGSACVPLLPLDVVEVATRSHEYLYAPRERYLGMPRGGRNTPAQRLVALGPGEGRGLFSAPGGSVMFACPSITLAAVSRAVCGTFVPVC